jgi:hypothetical protein
MSFHSNTNWSSRLRANDVASATLSFFPRMFSKHLTAFNNFVPLP